MTFKNKTQVLALIQAGIIVDDGACLMQEQFTVEQLTVNIKRAIEFQQRFYEACRLAERMPIDIPADDEDLKTESNSGE